MIPSLGQTNMLGLTFLFLSLLISSCFGLPAVTPEGIAELEKRAATFAITGAQDGQTSPRLEIHTLAANADQFNLYLLTMQNFQAMNQSDQLSYYQISGVHGVPNIPWDGANQAANTGGAIGYCTHSTQLFPAWHRVYVALFEQAFLSRVQTVISQFPTAQQPRWKAAAKNLRVPYWDWAATPPNGKPQLPALISNKFVTVTTPTGSQSILNPLFRYTFHPLDHAGFIYDPFDNWGVTLRYPDGTETTAYSVEQNAINTFANQAQSIKSSIYNMFTQCQVYATFSTDQADNSDPACSTSLEAIHGGIHNDMGGNNGHMTYLPFAGFDPSFWLHHANVDRLFALWQGIYPDSYMTENSKASQSTFAFPQGTTVNGDFGMQPFHNDTSGTAWTPNALRDWRIFHYDYPEFVGTDRSSSTITAKVNALYGSTSGAAARRKDRRNAAADADASATPETVAPVSSLLTPTGRERDWSANIVTSRFGLDDSYTIYVFLGDAEVHAKPNNGTKAASNQAIGGTYGTTSANIDSGVPDDASQWPFAETMVGSYGIFSMKNMMSTTPGASNPLLVSGSVSLTTALVSALTDGKIASLDKAHVIPYLRANLNWRVRKSDGTAIANKDVPGLSVSIATAKVTPASSSSEFPTWAEWEVVNDATNGKHGGLSLDQAWNFFKSVTGSNGAGGSVVTSIHAEIDRVVSSSAGGGKDADAASS
ncbi:MAG: hypothetical protein M1828_003052 [Chrysothrix sp. TS-e1954]|nr:MAG: hypothetical protein M1828_003052 [Chrysothrix sp. TS-e1954]